MSRKYDLENLGKIVKDTRGDEYEFVGYFYKSNKLYLDIKHKICGKIFTTDSYNFLVRKTNCTKCSKNRKLTTEDFRNRIKEIANDEYNLIGNFEGVSKKVRLKHKTCGHVFDMVPENFLRGQRCPNCNPRKNRGHLDFVKAFEKVSKGEYVLLSEYKNSRDYILIRHNDCGHTYNIIANNFLQGHKCPKCFKGRRLTKDGFNKKLEDIGFTKTHVLLSDFTGTKQKIRVKHLKCGTEFNVRAGYIYHSPDVCPKCKKSYGERRVQEFLERNNISFESQKKFDGCKDKYRLSFDFYIPSLNLLIEYDGEQHFKPVFRK